MGRVAMGGRMVQSEGSCGIFTPDDLSTKCYQLRTVNLTKTYLVSKMITDVPSSEDFRQSGLSFLNIAWDNAIKLKVEFEDSDELLSNEETIEEYWNAAQKPLATSLALAQQGIELLLKGRIAETSPFLLISGAPRDWPSGCHSKDTSFMEFRTLDSQDLPRAHDAVVAPRLSDSFRTRFERLRQRRNKIFHTVDHDASVQVDEVLYAILEASSILIAPHSWFEIRRTHLESDHIAALYSSDHVSHTIALEVLTVVETFSATDVQRFVGLNKKQRRYLCPWCDHEGANYGIDNLTIAQLQPNLPTSTSLYCFACNENYEVIRKKCPNKGCKGNVLDIEAHDKCLTCGDSIDSIRT